MVFMSVFYVIFCSLAFPDFNNGGSGGGEGPVIIVGRTPWSARVPLDPLFAMKIQPYTPDRGFASLSVPVMFPGKETTS
jgi:hypothetical protein